MLLYYVAFDSKDEISVNKGHFFSRESAKSFAEATKEKYFIYRIDSAIFKGCDMKPTFNCLKLQGCNIQVGLPAYVKPLNHTGNLVSNKKVARTSRVVALTDTGFETENSIYVVIGETNEHSSRKSNN